MSDAKEQESVDLFDAYFDWDPSVNDSVFELYRLIEYFKRILFVSAFQQQKILKIKWKERQ